MFVLEEKCIVQVIGSGEIAFIGRYTHYTDNIQEAVIFKSILDAQIYIEKYRLNGVGKIRKIICQSQ